MAAKHYANIGGETDAALTDVATTISSPALAALAAVASPDIVHICVDPDGIGGEPEWMQITAHTAAATTATVTRATESSTARAHASGVEWVHTLAPSEVDALSRLTHKQTRITGTGNKTTTTTMAAIDTTNLPYVTMAGLEVGDVIRCEIAGQCYASAAGDQGNTAYDVQVDRPTSADTFAGAGDPAGYSVLDYMTSTRAWKRMVIDYTVTEAGTHGFRPAWQSLDGSAGKLMTNAVSGADGTPIVFSVENKGPVSS